MRARKGFTLIELLVVVLIIGILAMVGMSEYAKTVEKSRATEAISSLSSLALAQDREYMRNGVSYATSIDNLDVHVQMKDFDIIALGQTITLQRKVAAAGGLGRYTVSLTLPASPGAGTRVWACTPSPSCNTILPPP